MNTSMSECGFEPQIAIPPGETVKELMEDRGMKQAELAARMGRPPRLVSQLISGQVAITPETACQLQAVLGPPAEFWLNLEHGYQLARARESERLEMEADVKNRFPYTEMAKLGWVKPTRQPLERVRNLREYFGVASLGCVENIQRTAWRKAGGKSASPEAVAAWLRRGETLAKDVSVTPYDAARFEASILPLKRLTVSGDLNAMQTLCAESGVVLLFVPPLSRTYACGVARWLPERRPVIQLTNRGCYEDILWFTLFHECAHILKHPRRLWIDIEKEGDSISDPCRTEEAEENKHEEEANAWASERLIPKQAYDMFVNAGDFGPDAVRGFAAQMEVAPAVVVGRLLHCKHIEYRSSDFFKLLKLRRKFRWNSS